MRVIYMVRNICVCVLVFVCVWYTSTRYSLPVTRTYIQDTHDTHTHMLNKRYYGLID